MSETPPPAAGALVAVGGVQSASGSAKSTHDLEAIKALATQTKAIGVILPPPDIRAIIDKTAQFVAKNGARARGRGGSRRRRARAAAAARCAAAAAAAPCS